MLRILGMLCIPLAILSFVIFVNMRNNEANVIAATLLVAFLIVGALLLVMDGRQRRRKVEEKRHQEMLGATREGSQRRGS